MGGETVTSILSGGWSEVIYGIQQIMGQPVAALGLTLPIIGLVVSIAKKLFRRSR